MLLKIRQKLNDECFVQANGKLIPTEKFLEIEPVIRDILKIAPQLNTRNFDPSQCTKTFRISSMMTEIAHVIGGVLPKMLKVAPKSNLDLQKQANEFSALFDGLIDFAVVTAVDLPPDAHVLKLYPLNRVVLLRKDHPLVKLKRPLRIADLQLYDRATIRTGRTSSWTGPEQNIFPYERYLEHSRVWTSRVYGAWEAMGKPAVLDICGWPAAELA
ncbi:MAG: LysR substrate-binding domain-containing protein, partial [Burkholderiales bacterium]|nr:LysR substrate-binding domain-containing protein [Burkholderiales bacterium]